MTHIWDTFPMNNELDLLEGRLYELQDIPNLTHVVVEAEVTHQDRPKPSYYLDNRERFAPWKDRIVHVWATDLPTMQAAPDPWAREHAQREWCRLGLADADADDVVLHGDIDEWPRPLAVRNVRPRGFVSMEMVGLFWSLRWRYPLPWMGTVAGRARDITSFGAMRDTRNICPNRIKNAGHHLSWLPNGDQSSAETAIAKVGSYCHPEVTDRIIRGLDDESFLKLGYHVDGEKMTRCEVDHTYPRWIREGRCPESWLQ